MKCEPSCRPFAAAREQLLKLAAEAAKARTQDSRNQLLKRIALAEELLEMAVQGDEI
jgi:hypothetical protein